MASRLELHEKLKELLGTKSVYYQPPASLKMAYPAIVYSVNNIEQTKANDEVYSRSREYSITVIDKKPDNPVIDKLLDLPYCSFDRHYTSDNLNHDVLTLYY